MSLGSKIEKFTKNLTSMVLRNNPIKPPSHDNPGLPLKSATSFIGMMVAGGVGVVAFQDPAFASTVQQTLGGSSLKLGQALSQPMFDAGAIGGAISLSALAVSKMIESPLKAIERWSNNNPVDIIQKASWKELKKEGQGQEYIKDRLEAMSPVQKKELSDYVDSMVHRTERLGRSAFTNQGVDIKPGAIAYDKVMKAEIRNQPNNEVKNENSQSKFQATTSFAP